MAMNDAADRTAFWVPRTAFRLAAFAFLVYALTGGGRVTGSDEVTMLDLSRAMLHGGIAVPVGATLDGPDGRHYTKNAAAQAVLALPLVAVAEWTTGALHLAEPRRTFAIRFAVSFFNAWVAALVVAALYATARQLGAGTGAACAAALALAFTTPLWVVAKSFMAEPLQALGLLTVVRGGARAASGDARGAWWAGAGLLLAVSVKLSMLPLALACLLALRGAPARAWMIASLGLIVALAGHAAYDLARFGTVFETGYGRQATASAYSTPLLVGLYGLVLSSGKGVMWFAPILWLVPAGWLAMRRAGGVPARAAIAIAAAWLVALAVYAKFEHWAGDGSFGPRYLVPLLPLAAVAFALALTHAGAWTRRLAWVLGIAGLLVQIGGVGIYYGAQMREAGDYPYTRALSDPQFMHESHFVPSHSPILGHWRLLHRNLREHVHGNWPHIAGGEPADPRIGIGAEDQRRLLYAIDFWWLYAIYAGIPAAPVLLGVALLLLGVFWAATRLVGAVADEARPS
jgi:hypothetical protein